MHLIDLCDWQYPETELDQLLRMGEIIEHNGKYVMPYDDDALEQLWKELSDVLVYEDEDGWLCLENDWLVFPSGTEREEIWYWFDEHYSKGVHALMFPDEH